MLYWWWNGCEWQTKRAKRKFSGLRTATTRTSWVRWGGGRKGQRLMTCEEINRAEWMEGRRRDTDNERSTVMMVMIVITGVWWNEYNWCVLNIIHDKITW